MQLTIQIELGNDGMQDGYDAFQAIAQSNIPHHRDNAAADGIFKDVNGNTVGMWMITESYIEQLEHEIAEGRVRFLPEP